MRSDQNPRMQIRFTPVTEAHAREALTWRYEPPYDFYNPPAELSEADLAAMLSEASPHFAVLDDAGALIGFIGVGEEARVPGGDYTADALDVGIGLRPDQTGHGLGRMVLARFFEHLVELGYAPTPLRATIASFNLRSRRTFHHLGFQEIDRFHTGPEATPIEWVILVKPAKPGPPA